MVVGRQEYTGQPEFTWSLSSLPLDKNGNQESNWDTYPALAFVVPNVGQYLHPLRKYATLKLLWDSEDQR